MYVREIGPEELSVDLARRWEQLRRTDDAMANPFFASELVRLMAQVCDDVRIGIVEQGGEPVAFLPFQRAPLRTGRLLGCPLMDVHGLIADPTTKLDLPRIVRGLGLGRLRFFCVPAAQRWFTRYATQHRASPIIRLDQFRATSRDLRQLRKMEREIGPIRFTVSAPGGRDLDQLLTWKRQQIMRTGYYPLFSHHWIEPLLHLLPQHTGDNFQGVFTTLHAGDRLVAAQLGLCSDKVWNPWFPAYDPLLSRYSPGLMLLLLLTRAAADMGIEWMDFGQGSEEFKRRLCNDQLVQIHGTVTTGWASAGVTLAQGATAAILDRAGLLQRTRRTVATALQLIPPAADVERAVT